MACKCELDEYDNWRPRYWMLPCLEHTLAKRARAALDQHRFPYAKSIKKKRAIQLARRAARGLLTYDTCRFEELMTFIQARGLDAPGKHLTWNSELIAELERADEEASFHCFLELPPELRVRLYTYHFTAFETVSIEPAPIFGTSRLVRQEARPLFYENIRFRIRLGSLTSARPQVGAAEACFYEHLDSNMLARFNRLKLVYGDGPTYVCNMGSKQQPDPAAVAGPDEECACTGIGSQTRSAKRDKAIALLHRFGRGLLSYERCNRAELRAFIESRGLMDSVPESTLKWDLVSCLQEADDSMTLLEIADLPPELCVRIYELHFETLRPVTTPVQPPITKLSALVRQESLPVFYQSSRFAFMSTMGLSRDKPKSIILYHSQEHLDRLSNEQMSRINGLQLSFVLRVVWHLDFAHPEQYGKSNSRRTIIRKKERDLR